MSTSPAYCGRCGRPLTDPGHHGCVEALRLEPPRYCSSCRRRMVVQVAPDGWSAQCSEHGTVHQSTWTT